MIEGEMKELGYTWGTLEKKARGLNGEFWLKPYVQLSTRRIKIKGND